MNSPDSQSPSPAGIDPIFQGEEPVERATPKATLLFQFFLFPLLIVVASVGVFLLFGAIGGADKTPAEHLDDAASGGTNVQKQAVQQLAVRLTEERRRVDAKEIPLEKAFFYDPEFRRKLARTFAESFTGEPNTERQQSLALCIAAVGDPDMAPLVAKHLVPDAPLEVRQTLVLALGAIPGDAAVPPLLEAIKDADDTMRNLAVQGLSRHPSAASTEALKTALGDSNAFVRLSAASALALVGDDSGKDLVARLLDPAWVEENVVKAKSGHAGSGDLGADKAAGLAEDARWTAFWNGIRAAYHLRAEDLKPALVALSKNPNVEDRVRRFALAALDGWSKPRGAGDLDPK